VPIGYFAATPRQQPVRCPVGTTTIGSRSTLLAQCVCAGGQRAHTVFGVTTCVPCVSTEVCPVSLHGGVGQCDQYRQTVNQKHDACVCEAGSYDAMATQYGAMRCILCPAGFFCPQERETKVLPTITKCPLKTTSHPGTPDINGCFCQQSDRNLMASAVPPFALQCLCASSHYESEDDNTCTPCPVNMFVSVQSMLQLPRSPACACVSGFYPETAILQDDSTATECVICPAGFYCTAGQTDSGPMPCPFGTFGPAIGQGSDHGCLQCPASIFTARNASHNSSTHNQNSNRTMLNAQALQGSVVDCFSTYTPVHTSRELHLEVCSFVFVVFSNEMRKKDLIAALHRIFNHQLLSVDAVSTFGRIQFSVTLTNEFLVAILFAMSKMDAIWSSLRTVSQQNPTLYLSVARYVFCDSVRQIAHDLYATNLDISVCYMPMDRMTTIGAVCVCWLPRCFCACVMPDLGRAPSRKYQVHSAEAPSLGARPRATRLCPAHIVDFCGRPVRAHTSGKCDPRRQHPTVLRRRGRSHGVPIRGPCPARDCVWYRFHQQCVCAMAVRRRDFCTGGVCQ